MIALRQYLPLVRLGKDSPCLITVSVPFVLFLVCCLIFLSRFLVCVSVFFFFVFLLWFLVARFRGNSEAKSQPPPNCLHSSFYNKEEFRVLLLQVWFMESAVKGKYRAQIWQLFHMIQVRPDMDDIRPDMIHVRPDLGDIRPDV